MTIKQFESRIRSKSDAELIQFCNTLGCLNRFLKDNYTGSETVHTNPEADAIIVKVLRERGIKC